MEEFISLLEGKGEKYEVKDEKIVVEGSLDLRYEDITHLPDNLSVGGWFDLRHTNITHLPDNLSVGESLYLRKTNVTRIPDNLTVGKSLYLDVHNIENIEYMDDCGKRLRTIFAVFINGKIMIAAGCFLGTYEDFCIAVDEDYTGEAADTYKMEALDCVERLKKMREE